MSCEQYQELGAQLALDVLPAAELPAVEAHIATCPVCGPIQVQLREAVCALAYAAPVRTPRAELRARVLAMAGPGRPSAPPPRPSRWLVGALVACNLLFAGGLAVTYARLNHAQGEAVALKGRLAALEQHMASQTAADADLLASHDVRMVALAPQAQVQEAKAWVYWSPAKKAWLVTISGLPRQTDRTYQLWAVTADAKVSLGTFQPDANGVVRVHAELPMASKPMAAAVSVEPMGGMPQPTGPIVMVGPIKQL
jgi:hypothetical protein